MTALQELRDRLRCAISAPEEALVARLAAEAALDDAARARIHARATELVRRVRADGQATLMESFLAEYGLSTREGVALMCLAEALLRVPDPETIDDLIADKIAPGEWGRHLGRSASSLVNASTWALMLTGRVVEEDGPGTDTPSLARVLREAVRRLGEPVIRAAVAAAMREMGEHFVLGASMEAALARARGWEGRGYTYSYDMLGEAARTEADAARYMDAYRGAIRAAGRAARGGDVRDNPGVSVKLSALHPRYEQAQRARVLAELAPRLAELARMAAEARIGLNIDAEESERLDLSLDVIAGVLPDPALAGWDGFGVVVQAYGRRAPHVIDWLHALARQHDRRIMARLVKGAYWDSEIKRAQTLGLDGYPVFTRKAHTDIAYLACARRLLAARDRIYPQFATHNAHSMAAILHMAGSDRRGFEFQRLHGMGETLHALVLEAEGTRCRIYAPVGEHRDLLAYLVRRLLENGANSSFVHRIVDAAVPPEVVAADPFLALQEGGGRPNPAIPAPADLFAPDRRNAAGHDLADPAAFAALEQATRRFDATTWRAGPDGGEETAIRNPADPDDLVGTMHRATAADVARAHHAARAAFPAWSALGAEARAACLERAADAYEAHAPELIALLQREAGKSWGDAVADLREAVDFLRYYAAEARRLKADQGREAGRGVFACIAPWNFPLAIFTGQLAAALAAGNAVLAKPAEQTPLIAARAVALLHEAGIPKDVLRCLPGDGPTTGAALTTLPGLDGVCFTGSTDTARAIARAMAGTAAPDAPLIAETGGLNAMIVDSTALPEQAVRDILASAFQSAGQRCSALRILYVQEEVADTVLTMLIGAMETLRLGDPRDLATDIGPVIDAEAKAMIEAHVTRAEVEGRLIARLAAPATGHFCGPALIRVGGIADLEREVFGPVLHVATFKAEALDGVVAAINASGYGLTLGLHSRVDRRVQRVVERARVGNIYVNRNQIGAVVGSQPFGGEGLSGTGPKAGGPAYLARFLAPSRTWREIAGDRPADTAPVPAPRSTLDPVQVAGALASQAPALSGWAARPDRASCLREALAALPSGIAAPSRAVLEALGGPVGARPRELPGPTGESNRLIHAPRGVVLCLGRIDGTGGGKGGDDGALALAQAVGALALGNCAVIAAPGAGWLGAVLAPAGLALGVLDGTLEAGSLATLTGLDSIAAWGPADGIAALRRALADRPGPILPLLTEPPAPERLLIERCISIDTTAAGGNAALLAAAE